MEGVSGPQPQIAANSGCETWVISLSSGVSGSVDVIENVIEIFLKAQLTKNF